MRVIEPGFQIVYNRTYAHRQEYDLARKEYDEVFGLPYDDPERRDRFQAARERVERAKRLLGHG